jgi:hypothetical protein
LNSAFDNEDTTTGDRPAESETTESKGEPVPNRNKRGKTKIDYEWLHKNETTKLYHTNEQLDPNRFIKAKRTELQSIDEFGVLEVLTQRQTTEIKKAGKQIISTRMDEIDKTTGKGVYDKTKSRLLVRGDLDKTQDLATEATTTRLQTFLLLVNYAVSKAMNYAVDDVKIAFCRAKIDREVYVKLDKTTTEIYLTMHPEFKHRVGKDGLLVCKLLKSLHGLKDYPRLWKSHLEGVLIKQGCVRSKLDSCLFHRRHVNGRFDLICVHVDDLYTVSDDVKEIITALEIRIWQRNES